MMLKTKLEDRCGVGSLNLKGFDDVKADMKKKETYSCQYDNSKRGGEFLG
jgi:hypothetical protein